jgi:uncharacterized membrane protein YfcA
MNWTLTAAGLGVGVIVGLTGMGGGALMTPMLVLFFGVPPLAAVSSDLVASAVMKPVGAFVHIRRKTVDWRLVGWLCIGSVPGAFSGVLITRAIGGENLEHTVKTALGMALLLAVGGLLARTYLQLGEHARHFRARLAGLVGDRTQIAHGQARVTVKPLATALLGCLGGIVVGMTSVGSGSLIIVILLMMYPMLKAGDLVGTDLVQAVPLVAAASVGHLLFGDFRFGLTAALLVGAIPGAWLGAQISSRAGSGLVRRALLFVLLASSVKLLNASNTMLIVVLVGAAVAAPVALLLVRRVNGLPALSRTERELVARADAERIAVGDRDAVPHPA